MTANMFPMLSQNDNISQKNHQICNAPKTQAPNQRFRIKQKPTDTSEWGPSGISLERQVLVSPSLNDMSSSLDDMSTDIVDMSTDIVDMSTDVVDMSSDMVDI